MNRMATDVGGTFTDIVWVNTQTGEVRTDKTPTTPLDVVAGVLAAMHKTLVPSVEVGQFIHGSTVATNSLITSGGARTGLITTKGFRDSLEIRRVNRPDDHIYNIFWKKPPALISRALRLEVSERTLFTGAVLRPVVRAEVENAVRIFKVSGVESIAICLLHSYVNPAHEIEIHKLVKELWPESYVSMSHQVAREIREYERASTTAIDAYVKKPVVSYLRRLRGSFRDDIGVAHDPLVANSNGGVSTIDAIERAPIQMLFSGPAGGAIGAAYLAAIIGFRNLVTADVGGTSFDVSIVADGKNVLRTEHEVLGYVAKVSSIDVRSVGAGGGSLAHVDGAGLLHVGPASAGAEPGPMCYDRGGTTAAVTDAAVVLGFIDPNRFAGGEIPLNAELSRRGVGVVASALEIDVDRAAEGILTVARNNMADITRRILYGQGYDPRDFALLGFGGGGGLFACDVARNLGIPVVVIPNHPAAFSAWGMLSADISGAFARSHMRTIADIDPVAIGALFSDMLVEASMLMREAGVPEDQVRFETSVDARYEGQGHEVKVPMDGLEFNETIRELLARRFDEQHQIRFGHKMPNSCETVTFRLRVFGEVEKLELRKIAVGSVDATGAIRETRSLYLAGLRHVCPIYDRLKLKAGNVISGPAIVEESAHITVIFPSDTLCVDNFGHLIVTIGA